MTTRKPVLEWRLNTELPALVAASDRHHDVYIITEVENGWLLNHPWSVTSRIKDANPEFRASLWGVIEEAERMEHTGMRFPTEESAS